jgi:hypothetical protein
LLTISAVAGFSEIGRARRQRHASAAPVRRQNSLAD